MFKHVLTMALLTSSFAIKAEVTLSGELTQGGLIIGKAMPGASVLFDDKPIRVSKEGVFGFGFGRDASTTSKLIVKNPDGSIEQKSLIPTSREYVTQRVNGIAQKIMNPDPKAVARSKKDNLQIGEARQRDNATVDFAKGFIAPIDGKITGVYGSQRIYNGVPKRPHFGLDYAGKKGDPVKAPASGIVTLWVPDMFYSGGTMIIDHGHGISSTFLHLSNSYVKVGDYVEQGQLVAAVGASGRATGPHLDWRINWFDVRLDPALALKIKPVVN